jgi:hypothetical protein
MKRLYALMLFQNAGRQAPWSIVIVRQKARVCGAFEAFLSVSYERTRGAEVRRSLPAGSAFPAKSAEHLKSKFIGTRMSGSRSNNAHIGR